MIQTWSQFFYDFEVTEAQRLISFDEGGPEFVVELTQGRYSLTDGLLEIASKMTDAGAQAYTVSMNRFTRAVTISAPANFTLRVATGSGVGNTAFSLVGFTGLNRTGSNSYVSNLSVGKSYTPQFKLQDWIDPEHNKRAVDATVKKSANGSVEVVTFGIERLIQAHIRFATNIPQDGKVIRSNTGGVEALIDFMDWATLKAPIELIPDEQNPSTFYKVILERTPEFSNGTGFRLKELYDRNAPGYFETGVLGFLVVE